MPLNRVQTPISLEAVETLIEEAIIEGADRLAAIYQRLRKTREGSPKHEELLCEASTAASALALKAREAEKAIDEYLDSLPDDDDDD